MPSPIISIHFMHSDRVVCAGLRALLSATSGLHWVAQECLQDMHDGIIIADYRTALDHCRRDSAGRHRVLLVAPDSKDGEVRRALASGVHGYLLQREAPGELGTAVLSLSKGLRYLSDHVQRCMADSGAQGQLTPREEDVLQLMGQGYCNKLIARMLGISLGTVKSHVKAVLDKLDASTRTRAVVVATHRGLISIADGSHSWMAPSEPGLGRRSALSALSVRQ